MVVTYQFNTDDPVTANLRELHVDFDRNILRLVVEDQQLTSIYKELDQLDFPNQVFTLTISDVVNPF